MKNRYYKKFIRIPPNESIDIRNIMPIVHHPLFQRLLRIAQLGSNIIVFPGASHNRFEHSMGVYSKTSLFCERLVKEGFLTPYQAKNISLFGLLHDIGHGPFSHVIEGVTPVSGDEDKNGLNVLTHFKKEITQSGGDYNFIKKLSAHKSPFYKIVMDKNLGMDKLDYLERDVYHTGFGQSPDVKSVSDYLSFIKGKLVMDKKSLEAAKQMQRLYMYMYKEFYLHKSSQISQRFLEKMIAIWLKLDKIDPAKLWLMNDIELLACIYMHESPVLKFLYQSYKNRDLPKTGLVIRLKGRQFKERISGKKIKVIGEDIVFFKKFRKYSSFKQVEKLENLVGETLGIEPYKIVIVPMFTPERFVPEDILYHDDGKIFSLKETNPKYFEDMRSEADDYVAVRVCIIGDRNIIFKNSKKIEQVIKDHLAA